MTTSRLAISLDAGLADEIRSAAQGGTVSGWLADAAERKLRDPIDAAVVLNATGSPSVVATSDPSDPSDIRQLVGSLPTELGAAITVLQV